MTGVSRSHWGAIKGPLKSPEHRNTMVTKGFNGSLQVVPNYTERQKS